MTYSLAKKAVAEIVSTFILVSIGCGAAMGVHADPGVYYLAVALAFGMSVLIIAYGPGNISGGHANPAVSLGVYLHGGLTTKELFTYWASQVCGSTLAALFLYGVFYGVGIPDATGAVATSGLAGVNGNVFAGLAVEAVFTCLFVLSVLGATEAKYKHGSAAGLVIAFSLSAVIFGGIALSSASYNPARSLGPAIVAAFAGDLSGLASVWVFIVGPLLGGALAAFLFNWLSKEDVAEEA
ncbi:MAG: aquaporin family protein [Clostridia bacterium]|nr:aquaporin family protein [Clostridia bacterium]